MMLSSLPSKQPGGEDFVTTSSVSLTVVMTSTLSRWRTASGRWIMRCASGGFSAPPATPIAQRTSRAGRRGQTPRRRRAGRRRRGCRLRGHAGGPQRIPRALPRFRLARCRRCLRGARAGGGEAGSGSWRVGVATWGARLAAWGWKRGAGRGSGGKQLGRAGVAGLDRDTGDCVPHQPSLISPGWVHMLWWMVGPWTRR